jgi:hypothetical protein
MGSAGNQVKRVIQLELNEISPDLIKTLVAKGELPHFKRIIDSWTEFQTLSEDVYEHIEPWIQWVTVHTGKTFAEHQIFHLGDAHDLKHDQIWEVLSDKNVNCAILGAMNATPGRLKNGVFFPDPWSKSNTALPDQLKGLWKIISNKVQAHASSQPTWGELIAAFKATKEFDIPLTLLARIAKQIVEQKLDPRIKWKLVGLFDLFLAEIFLTVQRDSQYKFLTLFLNSVAHYQHHFWRNLEPDKFSKNVTAPDCRPGDNPLLFGYKTMDEVIGKLMKQIDLNDTLVLIVSGLSQVPDTRFEKEGGMNYYRLNDHKAFASHFGVIESQVFPLMSRDWQIKVDKDQSNNLRPMFESCRVNSQPLFSVNEDTPGYLFLETQVTRSVSADECVYFGDRNLGKFHDLFTNIAIKSGHHTGRGVLWSSKPLKDFGLDARTVPLIKVFEIPQRVLVQ